MNEPTTDRTSVQPQSTVMRRSGAVVRFAGDSGDGMQITGDQFTTSTALAGNDLATLPDYPAEIRAPAGTLYGVSGFQIRFGSSDVFTPGDSPDVLVAMNPAALRTNLRDLIPGGLLVVNTGAFTQANLDKAGYTSNPLEDGSLAGWNLVALDITKLTLTAVRTVALSTKEAGRCKNFWTLGLMLWVFSRTLDSSIEWIEARFKRRADFAQANILALRAGYAYGETTEFSHVRYEVPPAKVAPGLYRSISGNTALAYGLIAAAQVAGRKLVLGSYPITPATDILHELSKHKALGVVTLQAEDEIAAICSAIGASFGGAIGVTSTSGPGMALKTEALGLAVSTELPLVVLNVQRGGPSTGLPTKTEQADLLQAVHGRNGETPVCVLAASTPANCFEVAYEAVSIALTHMTPVIVLSDGYLANGAEPWRIPSTAELPPIARRELPPVEGFRAFERDPETLARHWVAPGTPGYEHRIGGLEKDATTGHISYDPVNHEKMIHLRAEKVARIARGLPPAKVCVGADQGRLLVVGWGSTYGSIHEAVRRCSQDGLSVSHLHLTHIHPFPPGLGALLQRFERILVPELNLGQLSQLLRSEFLVPTRNFNKVQGKPFHVEELVSAIRTELEN